MHDIDLRLVRAFVAVAEQGGFSAAAEALHITQPALSRRIGELEAALGVRAFDRTSRRVRLTGDGEALLERSRGLLVDAEALRERARALKAGRAGVLRVGGTPFALEGLIAPFLARYSRRFPEVDVRLREHGGARLLEGVRGGELHLAVVSEDEPRLASRRLYAWRLVAVLARTHPQARRKTVDIEALADQPILALTQDFITRRLFDAACETAHLRPLVRMQSSTPQTLVAMARAGYGIAIVPSIFLMDARGVKVVPVVSRGRSLGRHWGICWDPSRHQTEYLRQFIDGLGEFARHHRVGKAYDFAPPIAAPRAAEPKARPRPG